MARKSRKRASNEANLVLMPDTSETWETAIYARLSSSGGGEEKDDTIQSQLALVEEYIKNHSELKVVDTYIDNGYSGTNFNRPEFERMMEDVRKRKIRCIAVKDLSRFGRDYLEIGYFIETVFPCLNVRLIAVNDNFDSSRREDVENIAIPIKNMVNAMYAKDISRKAYSAAHARMRKGTPMSKIAPYGYTFNEHERKYEADREAAGYVQLIFHWAAEGLSLGEIAKRLNLAGAPTVRRGREDEGQSAWDAGAVGRILNHPVYTGAMVFGRTEKALFAGRKKRNVERDEWMIFEGAHEMIVSREDFETVRKILDERHNVLLEKTRMRDEFRRERPDEMKGLVRCAECGSAMRFVRKSGAEMSGNYYICRTQGRKKRCDGNKIPELLLKTLVTEEVFRFVDNMCAEEKSYRAQCVKELRAAEKRANDAAGLVEEMRHRCEELYEDYANAQSYALTKAEYTAQLSEANEKMAAAVKEKKRLEQKADELQKRTRELAALRRKNLFGGELIEGLAERIEVGRERSVKVIFKQGGVLEEAAERGGAI